jgi:hypothetical protein
MIILRTFLVLVIIQVALAQSESPFVALRSALNNAEIEERAGRRAEAIKQYQDVLQKAKQTELVDLSNRQPYGEIISSAALHIAGLLEIQSQCQHPEDVQNVVSKYEIARTTGRAEQRALAGNNLAGFYWHCGRLDEAKSAMRAIDYDALISADRSFYLDNYGQLLESSVDPTDWADAAKQYENVLSHSPADENAFAGIQRLLGKELPTRNATAIDVADLLVQKRMGRKAADLIIQILKMSSSLSNEARDQLISDLLRAYALGIVTVAQFIETDWHQLQETASFYPEDPDTGVLLLELYTIFTGQFEVNSSPERLFPKLTARKNDASVLSMLLKSVADDCIQRPDVGGAAQRYAAAWMLDHENTSAALELAVLYDAGKLPNNLRKLVTEDIANAYFRKGRLEALYRESSQQVSSDLGPEGNRQLRQVLELLGKGQSRTPIFPDELPKQARGVTSQFHLRTPWDYDAIVRGVATSDSEAVSIEVFRDRNYAHCGKGVPFQSTISTTDASTSSFTARLDHRLREGDIVCVYAIQKGVKASTASIERSTTFVPLLRRMRNYLSGGVLFGEAAGAWHALPRISWISDYNVGRLGYTRYQERSDPGTHRFTALVNTYAEIRATSIPEATTSHPEGSGLVPVESLELGAYAPVFTHGTTWWLRGYQRAIFGAPLFKSGIDLLPDGRLHTVFAGGVRIGLLRLLRATVFTAPILESYVDVTYGNATNLFLRNSDADTATSLDQLDLTGLWKIPESPFYLGVNVTTGPGATRTGVLFGARIEAGRLFRPSRGYDNAR